MPPSSISLYGNLRRSVPRKTVIFAKIVRQKRGEKEAIVGLFICLDTQDEQT